METPRWTFDPMHKTLDLKFSVGSQPVHVRIAPRPQYCDRGHWQFGVMDGPFGLDAADSFPRYFMSLDAAVAEAEAWLRWRLFKRTDTPHFAPMLGWKDGRAVDLG